MNAVFHDMFLLFQFLANAFSNVPHRRSPWVLCGTMKLPENYLTGILVSLTSEVSRADHVSGLHSAGIAKKRISEVSMTAWNFIGT